jgi:hypothetical protein
VSLLDGGPHEVLIWPMVWTEDVDGYGTPGYKPADEPVAVQGSVQPISSEERVEFGLGVATAVKLITRSAPAGPWSKARYRDRDWSVVGEPARYDHSPTTAHVDVILSADRPAEPAAPPQEG